MSERLLLVSILPFVSNQLRDEALVKLKALGKIALSDEPGTLKYALCIPREDDGKSAYAIEEFSDKAALDVHMESEGVQEMIKWLSDNKALDEGSSVRQHEYLPGGFRFDRPEVLKHQDPHILFAELDYIPGGIETATPYWKDVVATGRDHEPGTLVYGVLRDTTQENRLNTIEAYESPAYLMDVHVPSKAIQESIKNTKHLRTGLKHHAMKIVSGYLYRST